MARDIECPECGEAEALAGQRQSNSIVVTCGACGRTWIRDLAPTCDRCDGNDIQGVVQAIVEKGRGTQLSVVGTRVIHLCSSCDADVLQRYHRNRPNPLMPAELPTIVPGEELA